MSYPADIDSFTAVADDPGGSEVAAADINDKGDAIVAIETAVGVNPQGDETDLVTRLAHALSDGGMLQVDAAAALTISSGAITVTQTYSTVETEGGAGTDDLDTISGGAAGMMIILRAVNDAHTVVIKHGTDNIYCNTGADISLDEAYKFVTGIYDAVLSKWFIR